MRPGGVGSKCALSLQYQDQVLRSRPVIHGHGWLGEDGFGDRGGASVCAELICLLQSWPERAKISPPDEPPKLTATDRRTVWVVQGQRSRLPELEHGANEGEKLCRV
jgi:hypothetical protein